MQKAYKLQGIHRHYDWGGSHFIPNLMGVENASQVPFAEYWMGAHSSAPSTIQTETGEQLLDQFIRTNPIELLGTNTNLSLIHI